jgi:tetratricopeptide (TPR) repeat protein
MKAFYIVAACAFLSSRAALGGPGQGLPWPNDLNAARDEAKSDSRWIAAFFALPGDVSSRRMEKETIPFAEDRLALDKFVKVRFDMERDKEIADECGVFAGPAIVFYDSEGNELDRFTGFVSAQAFIAWTAAISPETGYTKAKAILKNNPHDPAANYYMGCKYLHRRDAEQAWRYFENCEQNDPEGAAGFADNIQLGRIENQIQQGDIAAAAKALEEFQTVWPESDVADRAEYLRCRTLWLQGHPGVAEEAFQDFIRNYPKSDSRYLADHALEGIHAAK